jgi:hypothetical protein
VCVDSALQVITRADLVTKFDEQCHSSGFEFADSLGQPRNVLINHVWMEVCQRSLGAVAGAPSYHEDCEYRKYLHFLSALVFVFLPGGVWLTRSVRELDLLDDVDYLDPLDARTPLSERIDTSQENRWNRASHWAALEPHGVLVAVLLMTPAAQRLIDVPVNPLEHLPGTGVSVVGSPPADARSQIGRETGSVTVVGTDARTNLSPRSPGHYVWTAE